VLANGVLPRFRQNHSVQWTNVTERTLQAAVNRIIPPDDFPAAWEAGAGKYIQRILGAELNHLESAFVEGLNSLDAEAQARFQQNFSALLPANQDEILRNIEAGAVKASWKISPVEFFRLLLELTAEGYYSDPAGGGNRGMISWKMIGFDPKGQMP
jgi:hypothetical protein